MPDFDSYWIKNDPIDGASRAVDAWNRILADVSTVTLQGAGSSITVRIEFDGRQSDVDSDAGHAATLRCTVFGVRDHPDDAVADTVIDEGDVFQLNGNRFKVERVIYPPGEKQAFCVTV